MIINYHVLVRFMSEKRFVDDFMNGKLFMNYLGYYWDEFHTAEEKVKGQKDFLEGVYCYGNSQKMGFDQEWCDALATDFMFRAKGYRYCDVTCFTRIDYSYERTPINNGLIFNTDERMNGFGDYAVIITDQPEFLRRVDTAMRREKFSYICGNVDYHKLKKNHEDAKFGHHVVLKGHDDIDMSEDIFRNAYEGNFDSFSKTEKYAYQREWRITAYRGVKEECNYTLNLERSLRDIAIAVDTKDLGWKLEDAFSHRKIKSSWNGNWPGNISRSEMRDKYYRLGECKAEAFTILG